MADVAPVPPAPPRLFLIDGYALIYRAFYALIQRPLTTSRGENTSIAWGIANFLKRLVDTHRPEYLGWVHDSGLSFRTTEYPAYKATREKLSEELQSDFDRGMERVATLLDAYHVPILALDGYEADDVIGTLAVQAAGQSLATVIVSGDKDFQQLVRPHIWLLNPGRGGPAAVDEQWVGVGNASERLGVPPEQVTDYFGMVGDSSDNVPGVPGIGPKTAVELLAAYGSLDAILAHAGELTKKRPREALLAHAEQARLSKRLVTIHQDLPITLDLAAMTLRQPDTVRLRQFFVELEFHSMAKAVSVAPPPALAPDTAAPALDLFMVAPEAAVEAAPPPIPPAGDAGEDAATPPPALPRHYTTVDTVEALDRLIADVRARGHMAIDTEALIDPDAPTRVDPLRSTLVGIAIAVAPGEAYYLPIAHRARAVAAQGELVGSTAGVVATSAPAPAPTSGAGGSIAARALAAAGLAGTADPVRNLPAIGTAAMAGLRALIEDPAIRKTAQNGKFDLLVLRRAGLRLRGLEFDTMLASYVLDPGRRSHGLDILALDILGETMTSFDELCGKGKGMIPIDEVPIPCVRDYSCEDVDMTLRLRDRFEPQLEALALTPLFRDIEMPLIEVLAEMEWLGVSIDVEWFRSLKERFGREREQVEQAIYAEAGEQFNINSNPQLRIVLFEKLALPVRKRTATGASTDASVLQELADEGHVLPGLMLEYRELFKLEGTYLDALPALLHPEDGRLHTSFNQTVASTGRLSSSDPNLQNIPIRRELGRDIRRGFVPAPGTLFLGADYSQIELRLLAHLSGDPAFVEAFRAGGDIHRQTAAIIFDIPLGDVTSEMRARAKTINFATIYGQGPFALSRQLRVEHAEAKAFIARYFERFQGIRAFLDESVEVARRQGYVQTIFGRRRYIPELRDRNFNIRAFGERTAQNSPIQGSAADLIKIAMIRIDRRLRESHPGSRMLLQVHDELVFEVPTGSVDAVRDLVVHEMEHAADLSVPLVVDVGVGRDWLETKA
jgi:DNA polymerase-1